MGLKDYFRAKKPAPATGQLEDPSTGTGNTLELRHSPIISGTSSQISGTVDDIKHEVMVNYLYQQQCGHMWVSSVQAYKRTSAPFHSPKYPRTPNEESTSGALSGLDVSTEQEGVLLRKSRGNYIACPPDLIGTPLEMACRTLNVSVSTSLFILP